MIVEKNRHLEAAIALLGSKSKAKVLLESLNMRSSGKFHFFAEQKDGRDTAVLAVLNQGATVTVVCTDPREEDEADAIGSLIEKAIEWLSSTNMRLAQTVMPVKHHLLEKAFSIGGFHRLAILNYMERTRFSAKSTRNSIDHVRFVPMTEYGDEVLGGVMQETYRHSLDCPKIHGLRRVQDIIDGHRGHAPYNAQLWCIAEVERKHAGVLLLNHASISKCIELAYIGVVPCARRQGVGDACMHHAVELSRKLGEPRITLAVDASNSPAILCMNGGV